MKFRLASLFFLLSSTVFFSTPVLSMSAEVESTSSSSYVPAAHKNPFADLSVDYDNLVRTFNGLRAAGNKATDTDLVAYLVKDENWRSLPHNYQKKLVGGVVEKALELRLDGLMHEVGIVPKYRAIRPINDASDEDLVAYLLGESWKTITPDKQGCVVEEITRRALELDIEEAMTQSGILEKYRLTRAAGNEASDGELVAYLFGEKWATLRSDIQKYIVRRVEETSSEMDRDTVFGLIRSGKLEESFEPLRRANGEDVSDETIVMQALKSLAFDGWKRLYKNASFMIDAVARKDPRAIFETFDEKSQIEVAKTYRTIKSSGNKASDGDIVKYVMLQMGYKSWDKLDADLQAEITRRVVDYAERMSIPEWLHSAHLFFDEKQVASLFTDKMNEENRQNIIDSAHELDEDEDISPRIATIAANMHSLFTSDMTGEDQEVIIREALRVNADEIGPRIAAIIANQHVFIPRDTNAYDRADYIAQFLSKTAKQIQAIADHVDAILPPGMTTHKRFQAIASFSKYFDEGQVAVLFTDGMYKENHQSIINLARELNESEDILPRITAIAANKDKIFTPDMVGYSHEWIIVCALRVSADEIGPRMNVIARNADRLFLGVSAFHRAILIGELLSKTTDEIQAIADNARTLYLSLKGEGAQTTAIRDFSL